jgi:leader peptidase (prepilin peptidase)/N-methyltransferase
MWVEKLISIAIVPAAVWWAAENLLRVRCARLARGRSTSFRAIAALAAATSMATTLAIVLIPLWQSPVAIWGESDTWQQVVDTPLALWSITASGVLVVAGAVDAACRIIPNQAILPGIVLGLSQAQLEDRLWDSVWGGLAGALLFLLLYFVRPRALGLGDVKLVAFIGVAVGLRALPIALGAGILLGGLYAAVLLLARIAGWRDPVPYGPPLAVGGIVGLWCTAAGMIG